MPTNFAPGPLGPTAPRTGTTAPETRAPWEPAPPPAVTPETVAPAPETAGGTEREGPTDPYATRGAPESPTPADPYGTRPPTDDVHATAGGNQAATRELTARKRAAEAVRPDVPGYEVLGVLGRGGMGVVYKARQVALKRLVALKMILGGEHAGPEQLARFRIEAEAVARLQHPHIVQVYEIGEHAGLPFFSLEFVEGGSLDRKLGGNPQPPAEAARLAETLARAMHAAHERGIIHRDLKPANVLLTTDGQPKITDFGLAKRLDETGQTCSGAVMGTPSYMAPEQANGDTRALGPLADVYALGAILYELLTGRPPFCGHNLYDTLDQVRSQEPVPPSRLQPRVPRDLETICLKCIQKQPAKRYASAAELADDLARFRDGIPIKARPVGAGERLAKWARRRPALAALLVALALLAVSALFGSISYGLYEQQQSKALQQQLARHRDAEEGRDRAGEAERAGDIDRARECLDRALGALQNDPAADPDLRRHLEHDRARIAALVEERDARRDWEDRAKRFRGPADDAIFHSISITEQARAEDRSAVLKAAPAALACFGIRAYDPPAQAAHRLEAFRPHEGAPGQVDRAAAACYQVLLVWAEAEAGLTARRDAEPARRALRLLDLAAALGEVHHLPAPRAYHHERGRYLALAGDAAAARAEQEQAERIRPETPLDLFLGALDSFHRGPSAEAAATCAEVLSKEADHFWAQYLEALCYLKTGRYAEARAGLTACLGRRPDFFWARLFRATAESQLGLQPRQPDAYDAAEQDFARVLDQTQDRQARAIALTNRGAMWVQRKRWDRAVTDLRAVIALQPENAGAYANLAQAYRVRGDWSAAVAALDQAVTRRPGDAGLFHTRAELHLLGGDPAAAWCDFDQAIAREPAGSTSKRLATDYVERGHLQHQAGEYEAGLASFDGALRLRPDFPPAHRQRAETLLALGRYAEAGQALDRYLAHGSPTAEVYLARGLILARLHRYWEAVAAYNRSLELKQDAKVLAYRGWAYVKLDANRPALADFDAALRLDPADTDAVCGRGYARAHLGQLAGAVGDADESLRHGGVTPRLLFNAACTYALVVGQLQAQTGGRFAPAGPAWHYQERAVSLLRAALEEVPAAQRREFWRADVQAETDLDPVRRSTSYLELARRYPR